jgi:excinuclease ABC subunit C
MEFVDRFASFGPNRLAVPGDVVVTGRVEGATASTLKARILQECSNRPGVYGMIDRFGNLIYVGKSGQLKTRLLSYFGRKADRKAKKILRHGRGIIWEVCATEFAAVLRELELIRRWRPTWNVQGKPRRSPSVYIVLESGDSPSLRVAVKKPAGAVNVFGPIPYRPWVCNAVAELAAAFGLSPGLANLFPISDDPRDIPGCLAFLRGDRRSLECWEAEMAEASVALRFEQAARHRDRLRILSSLQRRLQWAREREAMPTYLFPVADALGESIWYVLSRGAVIGAHRCRSDAQRQAEQEIDPRLIDAPSAFEDASLVRRWFRRHPGEMNRLEEVTAMKSDPNDDPAVGELTNIGPTIAKRLADIGVRRRSDLERLGPAGIYRQLKEKMKGQTVPCCYYLYSLEGALRGIAWDRLSDEERRRLRRSAGVDADDA